jgi:hypothetical protein
MAAYICCRELLLAEGGAAFLDGADPQYDSARHDSGPSDLRPAPGGPPWANVRYFGRRPWSGMRPANSHHLSVLSAGDVSLDRIGLSIRPSNWPKLS